MKLDQRCETEAQTVAIRLGECRPQRLVKHQAGFEVRARRCVFDVADSIAQIELLRAFFDPSQQPLQAATQIGCLADVRLGLRGFSAPQEYGRSRWHRSEDLDIPIWCRLQTL